MTFRYIRKAFISIAAALAFTACLPDNVTLYDGPLLVEFALQSGNPTAHYSWSSTGRFWNTEIRGSSFPDTTIQYQLIGPHQTMALQVGYYVAPEVYRDVANNVLTPTQPEGSEGSDWVRLATTAVEGVDYQLLDGGVSTLPANSSFGKLRFSTSPTGDKYLYFVLTEMDLTPSHNARVFRLRIRP
jgi:hypothetical protein